MKRNIIYIIITAMIGILVGYFIFDTPDNIHIKSSHDHSKELMNDHMWTCSMHPQIMQTEIGDCPICGMDLIPVETEDDGLLPDQFTMTKNAMALANIQTTVVGDAAGKQNALTLSGKIKENDEANAVQTSYFSGRIERLFINTEGEVVRRGQLLATVYSPELVAAQQELLTAVSLKKSHPELYTAVRNKLKLWKLSENQINQIEISGKVNDFFPIYATVSGTVSEKLVTQGDYVKQGQILYKISNLKTVWAVFDVYENQIPLLEKEQKIKITTNVYPDKAYDSEITFIDPILNTNTRTVEVRVVLNNKDNSLKPGMFVSGLIDGVSNDSDNQALIIPASAVLWTGKRSLVYVKPDPDQSIFEMREVLLGNQIGAKYIIFEGLKSGEEIVTNGTFTVDAAAQLQGKKSMMNR